MSWFWSSDSESLGVDDPMLIPLAAAALVASASIAATLFFYWCRFHNNHQLSRDIEKNIHAGGATYTLNTDESGVTYTLTPQKSTPPPKEKYEVTKQKKSEANGDTELSGLVTDMESDAEGLDGMDSALDNEWRDYQHNLR